MASLSVPQLKEYISEILRGADLNSLSSKRVRQLLEEKLGADLTERKKEIDDIVMEMITASQNEGGEGGDDRRKKRVENGKDDSDSVIQPSVHSGYQLPPQAPAANLWWHGGPTTYQDNYLNSTTPSIQPHQAYPPSYGITAPQQQQSAVPVKRKKESTYSRKCRLSPELAAVVGSNEMARHDVVKKMWEIVKSRNLYDPKNKQFAICDDQLMTVFGVRRFRTFGMMKYLKTHITDQR